IFIAEKENKSNIRNICDLLFGAADLLSFLLIVLPLYPKTVEGYIYSVNLWMYTETAAYNRMVYWVLFLALMASGVIKILQTQLKTEKGQKTVTMCSVFLSIGTVLYLVLARDAYAAAVAFLLMIMKGLLVFRHIKSD
ncbi:MAG: XRE family transcriptional regulator, partial [Anaerotignum sp.]|nr:XRE family transcriptional regulator [Anaerotignum sp.]